MVQTIYNDGVTEEATVMEAIYKEAQPIDFFVA